ncbi:hypothetical protein LCGC14_2993980, partial [marine sediment metagenome]
RKEIDKGAANGHNRRGGEPLERVDDVSSREHRG